jgi:acetylornithine deacetylase
MVSELIGTPSVSSTQDEYDQSNKPVIDLLANWLEPLGFDIKISPVERESSEQESGKLNLIATLGKGTGGLLLSGHSDTVPFDEHLWQSDPFHLIENEDRWYGLGTCDMKSFFALAIEASLPYLHSNLSRPLTIMATADEESSMCGAKALTADDLRPADFAVIGEPTDLRPVVRHKGIWMMNLRVEGTSGHSSNPELGNNAIEGMHDALSELMQFRTEIAARYSDPKFSVAYPTLNFGCIHGGDNPNRICDHAELAFDFRNPPSMDMEDFCGMLESRLQKKLEGFNVRLELLHSPVPAFENTDSDLARQVESLTGEPPVSVAFGTEAPYLKALHLDTVVIGPGSIDQAHQPNEYLSTSQLAPATALLGNLIEKYCA